MPARILVVDDQEAVREFTRKILVRAGYEVAIAGNGAEALAALGEADFDLVLMDADAATITSYFEAVLGELGPLSPCLVYLRVHDVGRTIRETCAERGAAWETRQVNWKLASPFARARGLAGVTGLARLYEYISRTCDTLLVAADLPTLLVADDRPWAERERAIYEWLGVGD